MSLHRPTLCALALFVGLPLVGGADAQAAFIRRALLKSIANSNGSTSNRVVTVTSGTTVGSVSAQLESNAGDQDVTLVESDAWLHGAATIKALPKTDAKLSLTLYDKANATLGEYTGTLATDGTVTLTGEGKTLDVDVLAAEVFGASGAYELGIDLAGADTYDVACATLLVTESTVVTTCDKVTGCTTTGSSTSTKAEVGWDDVGAVWEGDLKEAPEGLVEVKVKAYDTKGKKLESSKANLGAAWLDGGEGQNTLATDDDPLTTLAFTVNNNNRAYGAGKYALDLLTVVSEGWSADDTLPVDAQVELTNGSTVKIPVNSYQRRVTPEFMVEDFRFKVGSGASFRIAVNGSTFDTIDGSIEGYALGDVVCDNGTCVTLVEDGDTTSLSVTVYGASASKLPDEATLVLTELDEAGAVVESLTFPIGFDEQITAVFASEVTFSKDPIGLDLSGKVSLLATANKKGKQETLAKGKFYGSIARDGEGDLSLGGADKDAVTSSGSIVVVGAAAALTDKEGVVTAPPAIQYSNGSGTKNASSQTSTKPELL